MNYGFLSTETYLKALHIFQFVNNLISKLFVVNVKSFVYNCVFQKKENNTHQTFQILKMKTHFEDEQHFDDESSF